MNVDMIIIMLGDTLGLHRNVEDETTRRRSPPFLKTRSSKLSRQEAGCLALLMSFNQFRFFVEDIQHVLKYFNRLTVIITED